MEQRFKAIWNYLSETYDYEMGDIVDYEDVINTCDMCNLPYLSMQELDVFEKTYGLIIEW